MVNFVSVLSVLGTTEQTVYTCPSGKSAIIKMIQVSNTHTTSDYTATVAVHNGTNSFYLGYQINVPAKAAVAFLSGDLYLQAGYSIKALTDNTGGNIQLVASVVEI